MKNIIINIKLFILLTAVVLAACSQQTADELIASAQSYIAKNEIKSAVLKLKNAIATEPNNLRARMELGKTYLLIGENIGAEKELEKAQKLGADNEEVWAYLTQAKANLKKKQELLEITKLIVAKQEINSNLERALFYAGRELIQGNESDVVQAQEILTYLISHSATSDYSVLAQAWLDFSAGKFASVENLIDPILKREQGFAEAIELKALVCEATERHAEAVNLFSQYLQIRPFEAGKRVHLAHNQILSGQIEDAERELTGLLKANKEDPVSNMLLASIKYEQQDFVQAMQYAELSLLSAPSLKKSRIIAGLSAYELGKNEQSYLHLNKVANDLPAGHRASKILHMERIKMGYLDDSLEQLKNADAIDVDMYATSAIALLQRQEINEAQDLLDVIKNSDIADQTTLTKRGILKLSLQDDSGFADLERAVSEAPENGGFRALLISEYIAAKMFEQAMEQITQWLAISPANDDALTYQGTIYLYQEKAPEARAAFKHALEINNENTSALLNMALLDVLDKDYSSAVKYFEQLLLLRPQHFLAMMHLQRIAQAENNVKLAVTPINRVLVKHPDNLSLVIGLARIYDAFGQPDEAHKVLTQVPESSKSQPAYIATLGAIYVSKGQYKLAKETYQKLISLAPNLLTPYKRLILVNELMFDYASGLSVATKAADMFAEDSYFLLMKGYFSAMLNQHDKAKKIVTALEHDNIQSSILPKIKAKIASAEGDVDAIIDSYYKIYRDNPKEVNVLNLARKLKSYSQAGEAAQLLEKHLAAQGGSDLLKALLAELSTDLNPSRAIELYEELNLSHPNNFMLLNNLAQVYLNQGDIDAAIKNAQIAFQIGGELPQVKDTFGYATLQSGDVNKALPLLKEAAALSEDPMIALHYAEALILNGEKALAKNVLSAIQPVNEQQTQLLAELNQRLK